MTEFKAPAVMKRMSVKKIILERRKQLRPFWDCVRVSKLSLDHFEACVHGLIKSFIQTYPNLPDMDIMNKPELYPPGCLLVVSQVKRLLLGGLCQQHPWIFIKSVDDQALSYIGRMLLKRIDHAVHSHPSIGKTLMV